MAQQIKITQTSNADMNIGVPKKQTAKEKAYQLINKYNLVVLDTALVGSNSRVKKCALIAVDEILSEHMFDDSDYANRQYKYWQQVKQEIEKL